MKDVRIKSAYHHNTNILLNYLEITKTKKYDFFNSSASNTCMAGIKVPLIQKRLNIFAHNIQQLYTTYFSNKYFNQYMCSIFINYVKMRGVAKTRIRKLQFLSFSHEKFILFLNFYIYIITLKVYLN